MGEERSGASAPVGTRGPLQDAPGQRERGRTPLPRGHPRRRGHPPADRAPFKVACSGESAPPGSPPGVPGPRLATNVASEHRAGPGGAANVAAEHRAGPSPPVRTTEKKSIPASRFNLPTRHPALGHKISRPLLPPIVFLEQSELKLKLF